MEFDLLVFINSILDIVDDIMRRYVFVQFSKLAGYYRPTFLSALALMMIFSAIKLIFGAVDRFQDLVFKVFVVSSVFFFAAIGWEFFANTIYSIAVNGPTEMIGVITGGHDPFYDIARQATRLLRIADAIHAFGLGVVDSIIVWLIAFAFLVTIALLLRNAIYYFIIGKIAVGVLLGVAPVILILGIFDSTRNITVSWVQLLIRFFIQVVLLVTTLQLVAFLIAGFIAGTDAGNGQMVGGGSVNYVVAMAYIVITWIAAGLMGQVSTMAAAMSGGFMISMQGIAQSANDYAKSIGGISGFVTRTGNEIRKAGFKGIRSAQDSLTNRIRRA